MTIVVSLWDSLPPEVRILGLGAAVLVSIRIWYLFVDRMIGD